MRLNRQAVLSCALAGTLALAACGRAATSFGLLPAAPARFQALVVGAPDPQGNQVTLLYDSAAARALTTLVPGNASDPRFDGPDRVSYLMPTGVESTDAATGSPRTEASDTTLLAGGHAWSSRGALAYLAYPASPSPDRPSELEIRPAGGGLTMVRLPATTGRTQLRFSPDGSLLLVADSTTLQVRRLDGSLAFAPTAGVDVYPSDATWGSDGTLYFGDARGVSAGNPLTGETRAVLPGVRWYDPASSPDGRHVVFEVRDQQKLPHLRMLDTATGAIVSGFSLAGASHALFVSPTELWYHEEAVCDRCAAPTQATGEILRYDMTRRTERLTGVSGFVADVRTLRDS